MRRQPIFQPDTEVGGLSVLASADSSGKYQVRCTSCGGISKVTARTLADRKKRQAQNNPIDTCGLCGVSKLHLRIGSLVAGDTVLGLTQHGKSVLIKHWCCGRIREITRKALFQRKYWARRKNMDKVRCNECSKPWGNSPPPKHGKKHPGTLSAEEAALCQERNEIAACWIPPRGEAK